jgi:long-chain acyl-CoA synthetase
VPGPASGPRNAPTGRRRRPPGRRPSEPAEPAAPVGPYAERPWLGAYPAQVGAEIDVPKVPLTRLLDDAASAHPDVVALAFLGQTTTYGELRSAVDRFARALAGLGVGKGDRVAIVLPNCPQNVIAFYAALRLGAVVVENNPLYTEHELRHQLADCGATVVVCLDKTYATVAAVRERTALRHVVVTSVTDYLPRKARLKLRLPLAKARKARAEISADLPKNAPVLQFTDLMKQKGLPLVQQADVDPDNELALLQYTGGTTGLSKGAMLTHSNLVANAHQVKAWLPDAQPGREVMLGVLPLFHAYGLTLCMTTCMLLGGKLVLLPRFDLDLVFQAIDEHKPTLFPGVPPIYKAIVDSPKVRQHDLRSIKACISGAMKLPVETQEQFERVTGGRLVEGYGMTETSPATHSNPLSGNRKPGSIGVPLPGTKAKVVDQDDASREVEPGTPGELAISGPQVFRGYWQRPDESRAAFTDDGYLLTGDVAVMDEDGFFFIVDRKKELIIAGGFNIYPSEIEEVLFTLSGVSDACVVGVPDRYRGETVKAFVVAAPGSGLTEDQVIDHCAQSLTAYKVPKLVEFRESLPRTVVGKVLRRVLVEEERQRAASADLVAAPRREAPGAGASAELAEAMAPQPSEEQRQDRSRRTRPAGAAGPRPGRSRAGTGRRRPAADDAGRPDSSPARALAPQPAPEQQDEQPEPRRRRARSGAAAKSTPGSRTRSKAQAGGEEPAAAAKKTPAKKTPAKQASTRSAAAKRVAAPKAAAKAAAAKSSPAKAAAKSGGKSQATKGRAKKSTPPKPAAPPPSASKAAASKAAAAKMPAPKRGQADTSKEQPPQPAEPVTAESAAAAEPVAAKQTAAKKVPTAKKGRSPRR